tara:strand:- start:579 stop:1550 length:972 start_codon:yes stop_codon:yes gene_type:complete
MKLLLENWRKYISESEQAQDCGYLYLFEGDTVRKTSFYDALNLLSESESAIETFLENWERSVDYHIEQIDEGALADMASNPVLYLSTQAFIFIDRMKEKVAKYAGKILGVVNKIRSFMQRFEEKHPVLYKVGSFAAKLIIVTLAFYVLSSILGGSDAAAGDFVAPGFDDATGEYIANKVIASENELRYIGNTLQKMEGDGLAEIGKEIISIADNPQDSRRMLDVGYKAEAAIKATLEALAERGAEIDSSGKLVKKAQEMVNNLPEWAQGAKSGGVTAEMAIDQLKLSAQGGSKQALSQLQQIASQGTPEGKELAMKALKAINK